MSYMYQSFSEWFHHFVGRQKRKAKRTPLLIRTWMLSMPTVRQFQSYCNVFILIKIIQNDTREIVTTQSRRWTVNLLDNLEVGKIRFQGDSFELVIRYGFRVYRANRSMFCGIFVVVVSVGGVDKKCNAKYYPVSLCFNAVGQCFFFNKNVMRVFDMFFGDDVIVMKRVFLYF